MKPQLIYSSLFTDAVPLDLMLQFGVTDTIDSIVLPSTSDSAKSYLSAIPVFRTRRAVSEKVLPFANPDYSVQIRPARYSTKPKKGWIMVAGSIYVDGSDTTASIRWQSATGASLQDFVNKLCVGAEFLSQPSPFATSGRYDYRIASNDDVFASATSGGTVTLEVPALRSHTADVALMGKGICRFDSEIDNSITDIIGSYAGRVIFIDPSENEVTTEEMLSEYMSVVNVKMAALEAKPEVISNGSPA